MKGLAPILLAVTICIAQAAPELDGILGGGLLNGPVNLVLLGGASGNSQLSASQTITGNVPPVNGTPTGYVGPQGGNPGFGGQGFGAPANGEYGQTSAQSGAGSGGPSASSGTVGGVGGGVAPGLIKGLTG